MQQVTHWLGKPGLGQYAHRFAENDISFAVLPDLTHRDLRTQVFRSVIGVLLRELGSASAITVCGKFAHVKSILLATAVPNGRPLYSCR
jgi:hypothetical protein